MKALPVEESTFLMNGAQVCNKRIRVNIHQVAGETFVP